MSFLNAQRYSKKKKKQRAWKATARRQKAGTSGKPER